jgi:N-acetylglucosamine kinase-like BadF-type ATPase
LNGDFNLDTVCICAAGVSNPRVTEFLENAVRQSGYLNRLLIKGDHIGALYGALGKPHGTVLISGTGSVCYGRDRAGRDRRAGGYGYLIDDYGSGYAIGRDMLTAVVMAYDGRAEKTVLADIVFRRLNIADDNIDGLIGFVYDKNTNKRDIAGLAKGLSEACSLNDKIALGIADKCVHDLFTLVKPVIEGLGLDTDVLAISGGIFKNNLIKNGFIDGLRCAYPGVLCREPKYSAAYGAVLIALEHVNRSE